MRMLKVRKKSISLIVVLAFLMTLFPMALPAFAASYSRVGSLVSVDDDGVFDLNDVNIKINEEDWEPGHSVIVRLPSGFEIREADKTTVADAVYIKDNYIDITKGGTDASFDVTVLDDNEFKLEIDGSVSDDVTIRIKFDNIYVDKGFDGDIIATFRAPSGSIFDSGEVVIGRVTGGEVTVEVVDDETFGDDGGKVTIRIEEDRPGALEVDDESVKFILPKGFEWGDVDPTDVKIINGNLSYGDTGFRLVPNDDELCLDVNKESGKEMWIEFTIEINVVDEKDADRGEVVAKVRGDSDVTPSTIVVGYYGDYALTATADDPTTVYAGKVEQEIADFTLEEEIAGSLVNGRSITLTLPDWAKWGALPDSVKDGKVELKLNSFPGKDGTVAKYVVDTDVDASAAELEFKDMEVVLSPDAPEGDLEIEISGTATDDLTIKVAEVKKPVEVSVDSAPTIIIGKADQDIGTITITEADAEMIKEGKELVVELPKDVEWDDYDVKVTEGDLEIDRVKDSDNKLTITIKDASNDPSTIEISGTVTAFRTVPEGKVTAKVSGDALIEVHDTEALEEQYGDGYDRTKRYITFDNADGREVEAIELDRNDNDDYILWDDDTVAEVEVAFVGTPAPGEQKITAVFKLGSTDWYLNDVPQTMDVAPYAKDGRTYLPMRYVAKALGIPDTGILWKAGTATFISADRVVSVTIGSNVMTINGAPVPIDAAPEIVNGRTMMPIRWIATAFGVSVDWNAETQEVTVN